MVCAAAFLSGCNIYRQYHRPEEINTDGLYRDTVSAADPLSQQDTVNMGNLPWREVFTDPYLQTLSSKGVSGIMRTCRPLI